MPRKKNNKYITRQSNLIKKQKATSRIEYEGIIDNRREEVEEVLVQKSKDFRKHNLIAKKKDIQKDKGIVSNRTLKELRAGFVNTSNKELYISKNREHIKSLPLGQQRALIEMMLNFL